MEEASSLYYSVLTKIITILLCSSSFLFIYLAIFDSQKPPELLVITIFIAFFLGLLLCIYEVFFTRYFYNDKNIFVTKLGQKKRVIEWKNIVDILESDYSCCYIVVSDDNNRIKLPYFLVGIDDFVFCAEEKISFKNCEEDCLKIVKKHPKRHPRNQIYKNGD